ncbi:carbon storage regulator [Lignipirellula cremea]|uniref:Translational regulator CsrA n=1 Tax=Lignipirellula cremea TaxID=2528010 RepID=A0A518DYV5_9BACT|nr:carbon storage regulator [Lignipirellula cremea]QDU97033.1 hypothetical protein Pla8534_48580 [Lignipirellula cremea]
MLVLTRKLKQEIQIGDNIRIVVQQIKGNTVRIGIEAPSEVAIRRGELQKATLLPPVIGSTVVLLDRAAS